MTVTFAENVELWKQIRERVREGLAATADAMADYLVWRAREITLRESFHSPGAWHRARPGEPPAYGSGTLARGMYFRPASKGSSVATAVVGNREPYSRIAESGCVVESKSFKYMHWEDSGRPGASRIPGMWYHKVIIYPPHPFLETTTDKAIDDGELHDAAVEAFREYDP